MQEQKATPMTLKYGTLARGTKEVVLDANDVQGALDSLHDTIGFELTQEQLGELLLTDIDAAFGILHHSARDTVVRENLMDCAARWLGLGKWPDFRKTEAQRDEFTKRFDAAALAKGLKPVT